VCSSRKKILAIHTPLLLSLALLNNKYIRFSHDLPNTLIGVYGARVSILGPELFADVSLSLLSAGDYN